MLRCFAAYRRAIEVNVTVGNSRRHTAPLFKIKDKRGRFDVDISNYQVTITEIERLTGLNFPQALYNSNPLFYFPREKVNEGPEAFKMPSGDDEKVLKQGVVFTRAGA